MLFQIQTDMDTLAAVQDTVAVVEETVVENSINLLTMAEYGGWIMIVLALMLAFGIYLFIERYVVLVKAVKEDKTFMNRIRDYIKEGKIDSAIKLCRKEDTPSAHMIEKGITRIGRPMQDVRADTLKLVLSEVLRNLKKKELCYIKYELKQGCFHITAR